MTALECRLIGLHACGAAINMALDQAMLESVDAGGQPTLRLYTWSEPTLSLGYFQNLADRIGHLESREVACVRRGSGGGAILHHHELTYSVAWPIERNRSGANLDLYRRTHQAMIRAIADFGAHATPYALTGRSGINGINGNSIEAAEPFLCFGRRTDEDLILSGYKILGSAQRKGKRAVLQHGSLMLRSSSFAPQLPGIWDLGASISHVQEVADSFAESLSQSLSIRLRPGNWTDLETQQADHWMTERFANRAWLNRR